MSIAKERLQKSVEALVDKAEDCLDAAKTQHANADAQHVLAQEQHAMADHQTASADELKKVGHALTDVALEIQGEMEWEGARTSPSPRLRDDALLPPAKPSSTRSI